MEKNLAMQYLINHSELRISEICEKLNVSRFIVHKWLSGKSNPRRENLNKLARITNVDLIWENKNQVSFSSKLKKDEKDSNYDNKKIINDIISNQSELIKYRDNYGVFLSKPGITGLGQVKGVDMSDPQRLAKLDSQMISNLNQLNYFKYLFLTFFGKGIGDRLKK